MHRIAYAVRIGVGVALGKIKPGSEYYEVAAQVEGSAQRAKMLDEAMWE